MSPRDTIRVAEVTNDARPRSDQQRHDADEVEHRQINREEQSVVPCRRHRCVLSRSRPRWTSRCRTPTPPNASGRRCATVGAAKPSMLQDFLRKRPTEIDAINGAVVREAPAGHPDALQSGSGVPGQGTRGRRAAGMSEHSLSAERLHFAWDNSLRRSSRSTPAMPSRSRRGTPAGTSTRPPRRAPTWSSPSRDIGHALSGPIFVFGAQPGDTLVVEVLDVVPELVGLDGPRTARRVAAGWTSRRRICARGI